MLKVELNCDRTLNSNNSVVYYVRACVCNIKYCTGRIHDKRVRGVGGGGDGGHERQRDEDAADVAAAMELLLAAQEDAGHAALHRSTSAVLFC